MTNARTATVALFFFAISFAFFQVQSTDVYMYLALARDFLMRGEWGSTDPYLYSLPQAHLDWIHEYLSYALFYGAHALAGIAGLILLKAVLLGSMFWLVLRARPQSTNSSLLWMALWTLAVIAASFRFIERSSAISDLFTVLLIGRLLETHVVTRGFLLRLGALFALWIQFHPGFPIGIAVLGIWALWNLIYNPQFKIRDAALLILPLAGLLINPLGLKGAIYPFQFALAEAQTLKHFNFEWFPTYHASFRFIPEVVAFWVLSTMTMFLIARERAWLTLRSWMAIFALACAVSAIRFVPWAAFAMLLTIKPWSLLKAFKPRAWMQNATVAALILLGCKNLIFGYQSSSGPRRPGFSDDPLHIPSTNLEFLKKNRIAGRLYNSHEFGAYMVWAGEVPVFHHGFVTDMGFYYQDVMGVYQSQARFQELALKYGWTMLLVDKLNAYSYFYRILSPLPEWKIVAEDPASYLIYRIP